MLESFARLRRGRRPRPGRGGGQPGRGQSARGRHRQHGLRAGRRRAGRAGRRHRARRRDRRSWSARVLLLEPEERALLRGYLVNKFRGDPALFDDAHPLIEARTGPALAGRRDLVRAARATCPRRTSWASPSSPRRPATAPARSRSPCRGCRGSPTSTISTRCAAEPDVDLRVLEPGPAAAGATPISCCCRAARRPSRDLAALRARGLGHRHPGPCAARRLRCWACAAATRCSGGGSPIRWGSRVRRARRPGWACSRSRRCWRRPRCWPLRGGASVATGEPVRGYEIHMGRTDGAGLRAADAAAAPARGRGGERRRAGDGLLPARPSGGRRLPRRAPGADPSAGGRRRWPTRRGSRRRWTSSPTISSAASISTGCSSWRARPTRADCRQGDGREHQPPGSPGQRNRTVDVGRRRPRRGRRPSSASSTVRPA